jgi:CheY-like chemotaxis protein
MAGEVILVVDDNPQNLRLARMVLRSAGYDVVTAIDANEVVAVLATAQPALIVNDLKRGAEAHGTVGLFVGIGADGHFRNLSVRPR